MNYVRANTKLPNSAIVKITKFASTHPTITELDLSGNAINDSAGRKLLSMVQTNRAISILVLKVSALPLCPLITYLKTGKTEGEKEPEKGLTERYRKNDIERK